jgi:hypothetical protein
METGKKINLIPILRQQEFLPRDLDKISKITAITGLVLFGLVLINYVVPVFRSTFPMHYLWYVLGFCFIGWFATRKGGCGSYNQGSCA